MQRVMPLLIVMLVILVGCNKDEANSEVYNGRDLIIGILGEEPDIREKNVKFEKLSFAELEQNIEENSSEFDAIFIMPEVLVEAADDRYVSVYQDLKIPIFFIESTKAHLPFVHENVTYETAPEVGGDANYATGYLFSGTEEEYRDDVWYYNLYNDIKNEATIKDVYSRIFDTIEQISL